MRHDWDVSAGGCRVDCVETNGGFGWWSSGGGFGRVNIGDFSGNGMGRLPVAP
jgi:hypothetical protein